jgi:tRNA(Ile)-lysidine synthase
MSFRPEALLSRIHACFESSVPQRWCVALSSGLDSTVALHALSRVLPEVGEIPLRALHVHHGLYPDAENWTEAACDQARALSCPIEILRVSVDRPGGQSLEDCARRARYQALAAAMLPGEVLVTGHHQDDQLETVILQLMRGAGVAGLAAMPELTALGPGSHFRPLLGFSRSELQGWATAQGLSWVEEPSNLDLSFDRNYLRHEVLPALRHRWPTAARAASRSARYCGEAQALLARQASLDIRDCAQGSELKVECLLAMDSARMGNVLRHWVSGLGLGTPPSHILQLVRSQVLEARQQALPRLAWKGGEFRRYRGMLFALSGVPEAPDTVIGWSGEGPLDLPGGLGRLTLVPGDGPGLDPRMLESGSREIRFRRGGERLRLEGRQGHHGLRELFQERGVLPWVRGQIPLLYVNGKLAAVGNLWVAREFAAGAGSGALSVHWDGAPRLIL